MPIPVEMGQSVSLNVDFKQGWIEVRFDGRVFSIRDPLGGQTAIQLPAELPEVTFPLGPVGQVTVIANEGWRRIPVVVHDHHQN